MRFILSLMLGAFLATRPSMGGDAEEVNRTLKLTVGVQGCTNPKGTILVAVYNSSESFIRNDPKGAVATVKLPASKGIIRHEFALQEGTYAVMIAQDVNNNHQVDKNWLGVPTEPIGVSRGFQSKLRKPTFAECSFALHAPKQHVDIRLERF